MQGETYKTQKGFNDLQNVASSRMNTALTNAKLQQQVNEKAKLALEEAQRNLDVLQKPDGTYNEIDPAYDIIKKNRKRAPLWEMVWISAKTRAKFMLFVII